MLAHWKRPWFWEVIRAGGKGDDRGWDGWMVSPSRWTRVWVISRSWWWTERPGMLLFMGSQRVRHNWKTELNWTELNWCTLSSHLKTVRALLFFSSGFLIPFSSIIVVRTSITMLSNSGESEHCFLIPDLRENAFGFSTLRIMFAVGLSCNGYTMLR